MLLAFNTVLARSTLLLLFLSSAVGSKSPISFLLVFSLLSSTIVGAYKQLDLGSMSLMNPSTMLRVFPMTFAMSLFPTVLEEMNHPYQY